MIGSSDGVPEEFEVLVQAVEWMPSRRDYPKLGQEWSRDQAVRAAFALVAH